MTALPAAHALFLSPSNTRCYLIPAYRTGPSVYCAGKANIRRPAAGGGDLLDGAQFLTIQINPQWALRPLGKAHGPLLGPLTPIQSVFDSYQHSLLPNPQCEYPSASLWVKVMGCKDINQFPAKGKGTHHYPPSSKFYATIITCRQSRWIFEEILKPYSDPICFLVGGRRIELAKFSLLGLSISCFQPMSSPQHCAVILCVGILFLMPMPQVRGSVTSIKMYADGFPVNIAGGRIQISPAVKDIHFEVGDPPNTPDPSKQRMRYRLEEADSDWRQNDGEMFFFVFFYGRSGDQVDQKIFPVRGKSPGWNNSLEQSTFTHRSENITVPPGAVSLSIAVSSGGGPACMGIFVVEDVLVTRLPSQGGAPETLLDSAPFQRMGPNADARMPEWIPDGIRPSMAKMIRIHGAESPWRSFCIIDDDLFSHAEWHSSRKRAPEVIPGERLTVAWNEMYNTGYAAHYKLHYGPLAVGRYHFRVQATDVIGNPLPVENSVEIVVPPPYWETSRFWLGLASVSFVTVVAGSRFWIRARIRMHLKRTRLVEQERLRISRDLHDDLGTQIARIALASANAESQGSIPDAHASMKKVSFLTRELAASLSSVVWVVNPENDQLESLVEFLCQLIEKGCDSSSVRCRIDAPTIIEKRGVAGALRHHVCLAVKEAVNNALRHGNATEIQAVIRFEVPFLRISISDNGKGFDVAATKPGNGLGNMRHRMESIQGRITLDSAEGRGTTLSFEVPIP